MPLFSVTYHLVMNVFNMTHLHFDATIKWYNMCKQMRCFFTLVNTLDSHHLYYYGNTHTIMIYGVNCYDALLSILIEILKIDNSNLFTKESFKNRLKPSSILDVANKNLFPFNNRGKRILFLEIAILIFPNHHSTNEWISELDELKRGLQ